MRIHGLDSARQRLASGLPVPDHRRTTVAFLDNSVKGRNKSKLDSNKYGSTTVNPAKDNSHAEAEQEEPVEGVDDEAENLDFDSPGRDKEGWTEQHQ